MPSAWLSLDSRYSHLIAFMRYMIAATLSNEITALPTRFVLVLDNYSAIQDEAVHDLFDPSRSGLSC